MDKDKQDLETKYKEDVRKNEQAIAELAKQKKNLDEKRNALAEGKKETSAYLNEAHNDFRGEDAPEDKRELEELSAHIQSEIRRAELDFEQEQIEINKRSKELRLQKDEMETEYRRALSKFK